jgi:hypothetical protein
MGEWQPIATAPKDGTEIILTDGDSVASGYWGPTYFGSDYAWIVWSHRSEHQPVALDEDPTHWMPLPELPQ